MHWTPHLVSEAMHTMMVLDGAIPVVMTAVADTDPLMDPSQCQLASTQQNGQRCLTWSVSRAKSLDH